MDDIHAVAAHAIRVMAAGDRADFNALIAPGAINHAAVAEPPACRVAGPEGFYATALWLRGAFADLEHRIEKLAEREKLDAVRPDLDGRQIMDILGISPGPAVGQAYQFLLAQRMEHGPLGAQRAEEVLRRWWAEQDGGSQLPQ